MSNTSISQNDTTRQHESRRIIDQVDLEFLHLGILQLGLDKNPLLPKLYAASKLDIKETLEEVRQTRTPAKTAKALLAETKLILDDMFLQGEDIQSLLALKAWLMDQLLAKRRVPMNKPLDLKEKKNAVNTLRNKGFSWDRIQEILVKRGNI